MNPNSLVSASAIKMYQILLLVYWETERLVCIGANTLESSHDENQEGTFIHTSIQLCPYGLDEHRTRGKIIDEIVSKLDGFN